MQTSFIMLSLKYEHLYEHLISTVKLKLRHNFSEFLHKFKIGMF